jgi:hypothetical protein
MASDAVAKGVEGVALVSSSSSSSVVSTSLSLFARLFASEGDDEQERERILLTSCTDTVALSVAFRLAYDDAACGGSPLFICRREDIDMQPPRVTAVSVSRTHYT